MAMSSNSEKRRQLRTQHRFRSDDTESRNRSEQTNRSIASADGEEILEDRSSGFGFDKQGYDERRNEDSSHFNSEKQFNSVTVLKRGGRSHGSNHRKLPSRHSEHENKELGNYESFGVEPGNSFSYQNSRSPRHYNRGGRTRGPKRYGGRRGSSREEPGYKPKTQLDTSGSLNYDENALHNCEVTDVHNKTQSGTAPNRRNMTNNSEQSTKKESKKSILTGNADDCAENTVDKKVNETPSLPPKQDTKCSKHSVFPKSEYQYEPTELKDVPLEEKKPVQISIRGWHVLSNTPSGESKIYYDPNFLGKEDQERYFNYLETEINWQTKEIILDDKLYIQPRLVAWFGPYPYGYSGVVLETNTLFPEIVQEIKNKIETSLKEDGRAVTFNSVLLNKYRDGKDSVAWHSDNEFSLGIDPTIASVSLGQSRKFELKPKAVLTKEKDQKEQPKKDEAEKFILLESGSLLVMDGVMQQDWLHRVPKENKRKECRINLTFRTVYHTEEKYIDQKWQQNRRKR